MFKFGARTGWALTAVAGLLLVGGCGSAAYPDGGAAAGAAPRTAGQPSFPVRITVPAGDVMIRSRPARIVSLSPTTTEDLYAIGAGHQVVAVDSDSDYPPGAPVTRLSGLSPNVEAIARYRPDLVVASQNTGGLSAALGKLGVPVLIEPAATRLAGVYAQIEQLGTATGHVTAARATVAAMRSKIAAEVRQAGSSHPRLTYYWELSARPYYSVTSATFAGQILGLFGLKDIADAAGKAGDGGYPQLSPEFIVAARPKLIFLADNQAADGGQAPSAVAARPGWSQIPAVADHEVIGLNDDIASRWGPRLPQLVAQIAHAVEQASRR